jgi:hypothetical protein
MGRPKGFWINFHSHSSFGSEPIGSSTVIGDCRWAGDYGVDADYIAMTHCSTEFIPLDEIQVQNRPVLCYLL